MHVEPPSLSKLSVQCAPGMHAVWAAALSVSQHSKRLLPAMVTLPHVGRQAMLATRTGYLDRTFANCNFYVCPARPVNTHVFSRARLCPCGWGPRQGIPRALS